MSTPTITFNNGATYERYMGLWSQRAGEKFLDWLQPQPQQHWLDIGCGNGAFTELLVARCTPSAIDGLDPSAEQLAFAAQRPALKAAHWHQGDAMALPLDNASVDAAVMPLVIFFVPDPAKGVAEMVRVTRPGGSVSAYAWDMPGGGFPYFPLQLTLREMGAVVAAPPSPDASKIDELERLWREAGLVDVETTAITVQREFKDFDDYWETVLGGPSVVATLATLTPDRIGELQEKVRARLSTSTDGRILASGRAHAVKGRRA